MEQKEPIDPISPTIGELRNELVDYTDLTPNEQRYMQDNTLDPTVFYPLGNMYPELGKISKLPWLLGKDHQRFKKEYFCNNLYSQQIKYAIKYLQVAAIKKFIVKNRTNILLSNPFYNLLDIHYPIKNNMDAVKEIIQILMDNYDEHYDMITQLHYGIKPEQKHILELLYEILPNDKNNECSICLHTEPKHLLINPCSCKNPIHTDCLVSLSPRKNTHCAICLSKYKINEPVIRTMSGIMIREVKDDTIFFPYHDLYYQPLMRQTSLIKVSGTNRLIMAIMYLQVGRVRELLRDNEILDALPELSFETTPLMMLAQGNMQTNAHISFGNNMTKYVLIMEMLLNTGKIDINKKNMFGKTFYDYLKDDDFLMEIFEPYII